ncbi:MAG: hypothetical protein JXB39_10735 [Deltaproteobacteria bacterium]|nr:hypothetical protein [Deltaproteobacteria bacterium]
MVRTLALSAACLVPLPALAQQVHVTIDEELARQAGLDPSELEIDLDGELHDVLHLDDLSAFLDAQANASTLAVRGMGVDYASNVEWGVIGGSLGTGIDAGGFRFDRGGPSLPEYGYAFQATAMAGINLGVWTGGEGFLSRVVLYGNGMALGTSGEIFDGSLVNVGGHVQLKVVEPKGEGVVTWGGLDLTSGFERSRYEARLRHPLPVEIPGTDGRASWDGTGTLTLGAATNAVPVEISTNARLLLFTIFGGGGLDLVTGTADGAIDLSGDVTAEVDGQPMRIGTASVTYADQGEPVEVFPRVFAGLQVNVLPVKVVAQLHAGLNHGVAGSVGLRLAR